MHDGLTGSELLILEALADGASACKRTNVFEPERKALAMRLDGKFLSDDDHFREEPFGVFFAIGQGFQAFHVRFRDVARGGMRLVRPRSDLQYARELDRMYEEAYGLAFAQQLKNKDIPEGGAKAVLLTTPGKCATQAAKAFVDSLLDLICSPAEQEFLFLGPDENVSGELIDWIVQRAKDRGYPMARAFMSSKPAAGINHKEYGVTSEGVIVFLEEALKAVGIDPRKDCFSVKITGGPDGDVAGNALKIIHREFGERVSVVGIADGSGCLEDESGLCWKELLNLVEKSLPVSEFDSALLGVSGRKRLVDDPDGAVQRDSMHHRVYADAFIPAGGRPRTMDESNWKRYLSDSGQPMSKVLVEGANLFVTPEARERLMEAGLLIVKDSSANKCGVICSSFEILASMLLTEDEFLERKEAFVRQVIERLRHLARREALLLFEEHRLKPSRSLQELSVEISTVMTRVADELMKEQDLVDSAWSDFCEELLSDYLPEAVREVSLERLNQLPSVYRAQVVATVLSRDLVYEQGIDFGAELSGLNLLEVIGAMIEEKERRRKLLLDLESSAFQGKDELAALLFHGLNLRSFLSNRVASAPAGTA